MQHALCGACTDLSVYILGPDDDIYEIWNFTQASPIGYWWLPAALVILVSATATQSDLADAVLQDLRDHNVRTARPREVLDHS